MADDAWAAPPDIATLKELPLQGVSFFQMLRQLEQDGLEFGRSNDPAKEPARLGQNIRLAFATQDVARFTPATEQQPARVEAMAIGLMGPDAPMPLHLTRWTMDRLSNRWFAGDAEGATSDTTFVDFANMIQHRIISLYYRAWADTRPEVQIQRPMGGRIRTMLGALGGIGLPGMADVDPALDAIKLRQAPSLARPVLSPERVAHFISDAVGAPVRIVEFIGHWLEVPGRLQTRLGSAFAALGKTAVTGPRVFQRTDRAELRIGPMSLEQFKSFLPGGDKLPVLRKSVRYVAGQELQFDLRLVLSREDIPPARLGEAQLGRTTWLAHDGTRDADDMCLTGLVGAVPKMMEA